MANCDWEWDASVVLEYYDTFETDGAICVEEWKQIWEDIQAGTFPPSDDTEPTPDPQPTPDPEPTPDPAPTPDPVETEFEQLDENDDGVLDNEEIETWYYDWCG